MSIPSPLAVEISIARVEVICMKSQLSTTEITHNQAFGYGYGATLESLKSFLVAISWSDLHSLNL